MSTKEYDLSCIKDIDSKNTENSNNEKHTNYINIHENIKIMHKKWIKNNKSYNIFKYDKNYITYDTLETMGKYRSVISDDNGICCFSPPKSMHISQFINIYKETECIIEEYIEGTMVNLFYDKDIDKWEIATKSSVGGNIKFFKDQPTFAKLFYEICEELKIDFDVFPKDNCYSFIMQHPENKVVLPIIYKRLYLIACYKIDNTTYKVTEIPRQYIQNDYIKNNIILVPPSEHFYSFYDVMNSYGSMNTNPSILGAMIYHVNGTRTKIHNPNYQYIKYLRGNNTKLQFQYLSLRKLGLVKENLKFFPENKTSFQGFKNQLHNFTTTLHINYINCYIKKEKPLLDFPKQFRVHMYNLHQHYLSIRSNNGFINKQTVIQYINNLEPANLMYSLNYALREIGKQKMENEIAKELVFNMEE